MNTTKFTSDVTAFFTELRMSVVAGYNKHIDTGFTQNQLARMWQIPQTTLSNLSLSDNIRHESLYRLYCRQGECSTESIEFLTNSMFSRILGSDEYRFVCIDGGNDPAGDPAYRHIGELLKDVRTSHNMSIRTVTYGTDFSSGTIYNLEQGVPASIHTTLVMMFWYLKEQMLSDRQVEDAINLIHRKIFKEQNTCPLLKLVRK